MEPLRFDSTFDDYLDVHRRMRRGLKAFKKVRDREIAFATPALRAAFLDEARKRAGTGTLSGAHGET
jgi:hypothetical protein